MGSLSLRGGPRTGVSHRNPAPASGCRSPGLTLGQRGLLGGLRSWGRGVQVHSLGRRPGKWRGEGHGGGLLLAKGFWGHQAQGTVSLRGCLGLRSSSSQTTVLISPLPRLVPGLLWSQMPA